MIGFPEDSYKQLPTATDKPAAVLKRSPCLWLLSAGIIGIYATVAYLLLKILVS